MVLDQYNKRADFRVPQRPCQQLALNDEFVANHRNSFSRLFARVHNDRLLRAVLAHLSEITHGP